VAVKRAVISGSTLLIVAAGVIALWMYLGRESVEVPVVDLSEAESQVVEKIRRLERAVRKRPESAKAWSRLARTYHAHRMHEPAVTSYEQAARHAPKDFRWAYLAAIAQQQLDLSAAAPFFERAAALNPDSSGFYINYGNLLSRLNRVDDAREQYEKAIVIDDRATHALYGLAQLNLLEGDTVAATDLLERGASIARHHGEIHQLLAQLYQRQGEEEKAKEAEQLARFYSLSTRTPDPVVQAMETEAVDAESYSVRGARFAGRQRYKEAEYQFRKVLEYRSGRPQDFANLGAAIGRLNRLDEAVDYFDRALAIDPEHVETLNNYGIALSRQGNQDGAAEYFLRAIETDPNDADAWHNLGLARKRQARTGEAVRAYREALDRDPVHAEAQNNLAGILYAAGQHDEAIARWRTAVEINPSNLPAVINLTTALTKRGEHAEAIRLLRASYRIIPESRDIRYRLAAQLATAPNPADRNAPEALNLARSLFEEAPSQARYTDLAAIAFAAIDDFDQAVRLEQRAVQQAERAGDETLVREFQFREQMFRTGTAYVQRGPADPASQD
jgi:tetratricopeptide (TPR) repeat protein